MVEVALGRDIHDELFIRMIYGWVEENPTAYVWISYTSTEYAGGKLGWTNLNGKWNIDIQLGDKVYIASNVSLHKAAKEVFKKITAEADNG